VPPVTNSCPLCSGGAIAPFWRDTRRDYLQCEMCHLVFVVPAQRLSAAAERAHYDLHRNSPADAGYRRFLSRLAEPLMARVPPPARGLDFGSGPGPTLSLMLAEAGYTMAIYDPFYAPDTSPLRETWDFICATEVVEHLFAPGCTLEMLWRQLRPGGWLGIMTKLMRDQQAFSAWHYKNDPTHVCFFSRDTWAFWAQARGTRPDYVAADALLLRKPGPA
jgi:SAM-dependent methyltransferase